MPTSLLRIACRLFVLGGMSACGGGDDVKSSKDPPSAVGTTETLVYDDTSPEDLISCLTDAGLPAVADDATPLLVEVPVSGIEVVPLGDDPDQGVDPWVFADPATAEENRVNITLSEEDTPTSKVSGNVVVDYFYVPLADDPAISAVDGCLPE